MTKKNLLIVISYFLIAQVLFAQNPPYRQFTTNDGLPSNNVYGVIEDESGFLWIYTEKGISKFDGYHFNNYSIEEGLPANDIFLMRKNKDGQLWMLGIEGSIAYIKNDSIFKKELGTNNRFAFHKVENDLIYRSNDFIWIVQGDSLIQKKVEFLPLTSFMKEIQWGYKNKNEYFGLNINTLKLIEINDSGNQIETKLEVNLPKDFIRTQTHYIASKNPYYLFTTDKGLIQIQESNKKTVFLPWAKYFQKEKSIGLIDIYQDVVTVSTNQGTINLTDFNELTSIDFSGIANTFALQRSYQDKNGNIWTGTKEDGLLFFSKAQLQTQLIDKENTEDNTYKFIRKLSTGELIAISSKGSIFNISNNKKTKTSFSKNTFVNDISITKRDEIILANNLELGKIIPVNPQKKTFIDHTMVDYVYPEIKEYPFLLARNKKIENRNSADFYLSHPIGFFRLFLNNNGEATRQKIGPTQKVVYLNPITKTTLTADKENLYIVNKNYQLDTILSLPLISAIHSIDKSTLLIGTESSGLFKHTFDDNQTIKIGNYGSINQIQTPEPNTIYLSSNEGIYKLKYQNNNYITENHWGQSQGLPSLEVFEFAIDNNNLYAGTANGIAKIDLNTRINKTLPSNKLVIQKASINHQTLENDTRFKYNQNDLSITYSLLDIKSFGNITYRYKLLPIQEEWQTTSDRTVIFNNLAPNHYAFKLEAYDSNNTHYQLDQEFTFSIRNPYWRTFLFYFLLALAGLTSYYFIDRKRKQSLDKELEIAKSYNRRMANLKLEALRSQMNPHFVFNSLGAIQYYIQTHKIEEADNYLTLFATLMRKYLNSASEQLINLSDELSLLKDYVNLEKMRFEELFEVRFQVDANIDLQHVFIPSMMIQPFVENAINHGLPQRKDKKAMLNISVSENGDEDITIQISDNGIGREQAKKYKKKFHKSKGMTNVAERIESLKAAELINIDINITTNSDDKVFPGTKVVINLKKQLEWNTAP